MSLNFIHITYSFYFVDDITIKSNNLIEFTLSCDLLATFKTDILNSEKIVLRTSDYNAMSKAVNPYGDGKACSKIVNFLLA